MTIARGEGGGGEGARGRGGEGRGDGGRGGGGEGGGGEGGNCSVYVCVSAHALACVYSAPRHRCPF